MNWTGSKKNPDFSPEQKRLMIVTHPQLSIKRQCELLDISRSSWYYEPLPETEFNLSLMRIMDEQYLQTPFYGVCQMTAHLQRCGYAVNEKRVRRLLRLMGLEAIYPKPNLSRPDKMHTIYPYLLRGVAITSVNHVWSTDITYIPMAKGFMYLAAVMDWHSRYVLSWELSNSMESSFCVEVLQRALEKHGNPQIFNTDQGSQFTSNSFTGVLLDKGISISMDGKGRATDNVFIERLWRSLKYEYVYLDVPETGPQLYKGLDKYFEFYNRQRPHSSLKTRTPHEIYYDHRKNSNFIPPQDLPILT